MAKISNIELYERLRQITSIEEDYNDEIDYRLVFTRLSKKSKSVISGVFDQHSPKTIDDVISILQKLDDFGRGVKLEKHIYCYGEEIGTSLFEKYKDRQRYTNTLEYKKEAFGWNKDEFEKYNKSRAITLENMTAKYGEVDGTKVFEEYCKKQSVNGNKLEYFIDKLGENEGKKYYENLNGQKAHTFETYLFRYGSEEVAIKKLQNFWQKQSSSFYSKVSQQFFSDLVNLYDIFGDKVYYASLNGEYGVYSREYKRYFKYDFVSIDLKIAIEFNGDHYHGNPSLYKPDDQLKGWGQKNTAKTVWELDRIKKLVLKDERDFEVITIWESDYMSNPDETCKKVYQYVTKNNRN